MAPGRCQPRDSRPWRDGSGGDRGARGGRAGLELHEDRGQRSLLCAHLRCVRAAGGAVPRTSRRGAVDTRRCQLRALSHRLPRYRQQLPVDAVAREEDWRSARAAGIAAVTARGRRAHGALCVRAPHVVVHPQARWAHAIPAGWRSTARRRRADPRAHRHAAVTAAAEFQAGKGTRVRETAARTVRAPVRIRPAACIAMNLTARPVLLWLLVAAFWLLNANYGGVVHDAELYAFQAMAHH